MRVIAAWTLGFSLLVTQAHAQTRPQSDNYRMPTDVQAVGGGEAAKSTNYLLDDTIGEANIGESRSDLFQLDAGYRQTLETYLAFGCDDQADLGTITFTGQANASVTCTVTTDADAGYALKWTNRTASGGVMTGSLISPTEQEIPPLAASREGLVGHWKLDEASAGGDVVDSSGNGNDGTPIGAGGAQNKPQPSSDLPSNINTQTLRSLDFDGADDRIGLGNDSSLQLSNGTVSAWLKTDNAGWSYRGIVSKQNAYGMYLVDNVLYLFDWHAYTGRNTGISLNDNEWHHVAFSFQSGVTNGTVVYIDGVAQLTTTMTVWGQSVEVQIGDGNANQYFNGLIDEVRIYNRVLTADEIKALYAEPHSWSVPSTRSAWGARLSSTSDDTDAKWGTDSSSEKWLNVGDGDYTMVTRTSRTDEDGSEQVIQFRAEVGAQKIQQTGIYRSTVELTAVSL